MIWNVINIFKSVSFIVYGTVLLAAPFALISILVIRQLERMNCREVALALLDQHPGGMTAARLAYRMRPSMRPEMYDKLMPEDVEKLLEGLKAEGRVDVVVVEKDGTKRWHSRPKS